MNTLLGNTTIKVWLKFSKKKYGLKKKNSWYSYKTVHHTIQVSKLFLFSSQSKIVQELNSKLYSRKINYLFIYLFIRRIDLLKLKHFFL